ncbi:MAG: phosphatase PAP2 family protein [Steroidobacteraceae bacterium]
MLMTNHCNATRGSGPHPAGWLLVLVAFLSPIAQAGSALLATAAAPTARSSAQTVAFASIHAPRLHLQPRAAVPIDIDSQSAAGLSPPTDAIITGRAPRLGFQSTADTASSPLGADPAPAGSSAPRTQASVNSRSSKVHLHPKAWWQQHKWALPAIGLTAFLAAMRIHEGTSHGPFGIDYRLSKQDSNGIMSRTNQLGLEYGTVAFETLGALFLGNHKGLGHVFWQAADSSVFAGFAADAMKIAFARARPYQNKGPNAFFDGGSRSFPSGEVTLQASFVTPFILHYRHRYPWIWAAELLPVYDAYGRMKSQGHWQSDVLAGWILGTAFGYWASRRKIPLLVEVLPHGVSVGFYREF